jgi:hypothetical protein
MANNKCLFMSLFAAYKSSVIVLPIVYVNCLFFVFTIKRSLYILDTSPLSGS